MALTKVIGEGVQGISNASDATFLTATSSEGVTLAGTLAVTGVHTVGENAIFDTEGNGATQNLVQSLVKQWLRFNQDTPAVNDSLNVSSVTDSSTGNYVIVPSNNWSNTNMCATCMAQAELANADSTQYFTVGGLSTTAIPRVDIENNSARDMANSCTICAGDLA